MKYILICSGAAVIAFLCGYVIARAARKLSRTRIKRAGMVLITVFGGCSVLLLIMLGYFGVYYHAGDKAQEALTGSDTVTVEKIDGGYRFDGPSEDHAVIFYSGGKVESEAYAPLMLKLAEAGFDCFLAEMPFHFPIFGSNIADRFISSYDYDEWIMAGHSLGGVVASSYAKRHADQICGMILLASYSSVKVEDSVKLCSIYGSEDNCLDMEQYKATQVNRPEQAMEHIIEGGNHAQFGDYGAQKGDGLATITGDEQQSITVKVIADYFCSSEISES